MSERLLTAEEVADLLGVPEGWPLAQARQGHIPHVRLGRYVRFDRADVLAWVESLKDGGGPDYRKHRPLASDGRRMSITHSNGPAAPEGSGPGTGGTSSHARQA